MFRWFDVCYVVLWRIRVFRMRSRSVMLNIMRSIFFAPMKPGFWVWWLVPMSRCHKSSHIRWKLSFFSFVVCSREILPETSLLSWLLLFHDPDHPRKNNGRECFVDNQQKVNQSIVIYISCVAFLVVENYWSIFPVSRHSLCMSSPPFCSISAVILSSPGVLSPFSLLRAALTSDGRTGGGGSPCEV